MLNISELHRGTLVMDASALFLLAGLIIYTSVYRHRGHRDDQLFFMLCIITAVMSVADAITYVVDGSTFSWASGLSMVCNVIFFLTFELFAGFVTQYMLVRVRRGMQLPWWLDGVLVIPVFLSVLMILVNCFFPFLFYINENNEYVFSKFYDMIFVAPAFYGVLVLMAIIRLDAKVTWIYVVLLLLRIVVGNLLRDISSTPLIFAMGLVFIHIHIMGRPFYEEAS